MSNVTSPSASRTNIDSVFNAALRTYNKKTGKDITSHPLATELQSCDSPDAILALLQRQIPTPDPSQSGDETFAKCLVPTVNVLYTLSDTLGEGVGLVITTMPPRLRTCALTVSPRCSHQQKLYLLVSVSSSWSVIFVASGARSGSTRLPGPFHMDTQHSF